MILSLFFIVYRDPVTMSCFIFPEDEKIQDGHECSLKDKQKTMIQDHSQIRGQQKEEEGGFGELS